MRAASDVAPAQHQCLAAAIASPQTLTCIAQSVTSLHSLVQTCTPQLHHASAVTGLLQHGRHPGEGDAAEGSL